MILQLEKNKVHTNSKTISTSVRHEDLNKLKYILSTSLYSDCYSFIREITANSIDSNLLAGYNEKAIININVDDGGQYVEFIDKGSGISPKFMEEVFSKIGYSTKEQDGNALGYFGLGRASVLAYQSKAYFITNFDNVKYTYILSTNDGMQFNLISEEDTVEPNGTTVKVYLKNQYGEENTIINEIHKKCIYFDNVIFKSFVNPLIKHETFLFSEDFKGDNNIHISLGGVYYKIPYDKLNITPIKIPVAIPFKIGELNVTPNREELRLDRNSINLIKSKINNFIEYAKTKAPLEFNDLDKYLYSLANGGFYLLDDLFIKFEDLGVTDSLVFTPLLPLKLQNILPDLDSKKIVKTKLIKNTNNNIRYSQYSKLYICDKNCLNEKYFKNYMQDDIVLEIPKFKLNKYKDFLNLKDFPKSEWRTLITFYQNWFKKQFNLTTFTEVKQSQGFKDYVKNEKSELTIKRNSGIKRDNIIHYARLSETGADRIIWHTLSKITNGFPNIVVSKNTTLDDLNWLYNLTNRKYNIVREKIENFEFIKKHSIIAEVYYANIINKWLDTNNNFIAIVKEFEPEVYKEIVILRDFKKKHSTQINLECSDFYDSLKILMDLHNITNPITEVIKKVDDFLIEYKYLKMLTDLQNYKDYYKLEFEVLINYIKNLKNNQC